MEVGFVKSQGRLTIPAKLRNKYGIKPSKDDGIKIIPIVPESIDKNIGFLKSKKSLLKGKKRK